MSKKLNLLAILTLSLMVMFTVSCEGPAGEDGAMGPEGPAGEDGQDAQVTCLGCHNDATLLDNQLEMARSQHGIGEFADYAGGRSSCAKCHSHEGFVEWAASGTVSGNYLTPTEWKCSTCHGLHQTFDEGFADTTDYALRTTSAITMLFDETTEADIDPSSNLCVNCHQARRAADYYDDGTGTMVMLSSSHAGPHHGPQSNLLLGNNGTTAGSPFTQHVEAGCVGCHMKETTGDDLNVAGGHTFWATVESCQDCHSSATSLDVFNVQTNTAAKLETLAGILENLEGNAIERIDGVWTVIADSTVHGPLHFDEEDGAYHPVVGQYDRAVFNAFWDYMYVAEDRSLGVHNPTYANALLDAAIAAVE